MMYFDFKNRSFEVLTTVWIFALLFSFNFSFPRPFDDWKNFLFYLGALLITLATLFLRKEFVRIPSIIQRILCFYFIFLFVSLIFVTPREESILEFCRLLLWVFLIWTWIQWPSENILRILSYSCIGAAFIAFLSFLGCRGLSVWQLKSSVVAPIGHVTYYGDVMALHLPLALFFCVKAEKFLSRCFWGAITFLIALGLWLSGTRASILGFLLAGFFGLCLLIYYRRWTWKQALLAGFSFFALGFLFYFLQPIGLRSGDPVIRRLGILTHAYQSSNIEQVSGGRWHTYENSLEMMKEKSWMGWGLGNFRFFYPRFDHQNAYAHFSNARTFYYHPHQELIHQGVELGYLGLLLFVFLFVSLFVCALRKLVFCDAIQKDRIILALVGILTALISWQFSTSFLFPLDRLFFAAYVALLFSEEEAAPVLAKNRLTKRITLACVIFTAGLILLFYHASLFFTEKAYQQIHSPDSRRWAALAHSLAPGTYEGLYVHVVAENLFGPPASSQMAVEAILKRYPELPAVQFEVARYYLRIQDFDRSIFSLNWAIRNDPKFQMAKDLRQQVMQMQLDLR